MIGDLLRGQQGHCLISNGTDHHRVLHVKLDYLDHNLNLIKKKSNTAEIILMVKANAYGHGLVPITHFAFHENNIKHFGVASLNEALVIRKELPSLPIEIFLFSDFDLTSKSLENVLDQRLTPVVSQMENLDVFLSSKKCQHIPLCLKFNTGMNRLGFHKNELEQIIIKLKKANRREIHHLFSHFSSSQIELSQNLGMQKQIDLFQEIKKIFTQEGFSIHHSSIANSGAIEQEIISTENFVRPGLVAYGPQSFRHQEKNDHFKIVSSLEGRVLQRFHLKKGETFGYNDTVCEEDSEVIIINLGYADGIFPFFIDSPISIENEVGHIRGRVNMDMTFVAFKKLSPKIQKNSLIKIWDHTQDSFSQFLNGKCIPYLLLTGLNQPRIKKIYHQ